MANVKTARAAAVAVRRDAIHRKILPGPGNAQRNRTERSQSATFGSFVYFRVEDKPAIAGHASNVKLTLALWTLLTPLLASGGLNLLAFDAGWHFVGLLGSTLRVNASAGIGGHAADRADSASATNRSRLRVIHRRKDRPGDGIRGEGPKWADAENAGLLIHHRLPDHPPQSGKLLSWAIIDSGYEARSML